MSDDDPVRVTVAEASVRLDQLAERASHGEVIHLVSGDREIARLVGNVPAVQSGLAGFHDGGPRRADGKQQTQIV